MPQRVGSRRAHDRARQRRWSFVHFTRAVAEESIQKKAVVYDPTGEGHYDTISAFIKSMRGSDPDAAIYWLAKMLYAGEDIRFIARRLVICASEDVGLADSQALVVAVAAQQAAEFVGMPEARIPLAQATVYIATAPKSNRAYMAVEKASAEVREGVTLPVPVPLRGNRLPGRERRWATGSATSTATTTRTPTFRRPTCPRGGAITNRATAVRKNASPNGSNTGGHCSRKVSRGGKA